MSDSLERVVITAPEPAAPTGHDQKMIDLVDSKNVDPNAPVRPDWLPAKFATVEDMAKSYVELEAKQGGAKPAVETPVVAPVVASVDPLEIAKPAAAEAAVVKAGLDMAALNAEYAKDGALSEASLASLAAAGFDKATVDTYIQGRQALADRFAADVTSVTPGGASNYPEMTAWAKANLTFAEIDTFNDSVGSGNADRAKLAVAGLGARFTAAVGSEPKLSGGATSSQSTDVFESIAQMTSAMSDPKYKSDPAYREAVRQKLGRSSIM